ncbi:hypothetical protein FNW25_00065 [Flavobacterium franklandianum]|uniref:hypothetical protein n=1 Tax=Flavobacterium franklandianum TaxID=2594430 RepID=UPI00117A0D3A|nr:hypothetical protein [Flavobacterium franklandianum]TRX29928.1 hypothetical protein FNW25_00065 [Flavobacterium franklandianum]
MNNKNFSDYDISLRGQLFVNLPVTVIIITAFGLSMFFDVNFKIALLVGMVLGWIYWSFSVKRWIQWATKNDVDIDRLVKIGKRGLLVWSKNTVETVTKHNKTPFI